MDKLIYKLRERIVGYFKIPETGFYDGTENLIIKPFNKQELEKLEKALGYQKTVHEIKPYSKKELASLFKFI